MFSYSPSQAAEGGPNGEGHVRPSLSSDPLWLLDPLSDSRSLTFSQCRLRSLQLATVFRKHLGLTPTGKGQADGVVCVYSPNDIDYATTIWATFRLGGILSGANPSYTPSELSYQLSVLAKTHELKGLVTHPASLEVALKAAKEAGVPREKVLLMGCPGGKKPDSVPKEILTFEEAIKRYASSTTEEERLDSALPKRRKLEKGEAREKLAFLSFSSGTTGLPKAVCIPHYSVVSNVVQYARGCDGKIEAGSKV